MHDGGSMYECNIKNSITNVDLTSIDKRAKRKSQQTCMNAIMKLMYYYNFDFSSTGHKLASGTSKSFGDTNKVTQLFIENDTIKIIRGTNVGHKRPYMSRDIDRLYDEPMSEDEVMNRLGFTEDKDIKYQLFFGGIISFALCVLMLIKIDLHWILEGGLLLFSLFNAVFVCFTISLLSIENNYRLVFNSDIAKLSELYSHIQHEREKRMADISISHAYDYGITPMDAALQLRLENKSLYELDTYYDLSFV